uniref:Solute carrier family 2, facilitated glucose transporter member 5 n=1 Tax=Electrophorus electricus TaxID=8005 RepID=A0AAY5E8M5_ELEEL
MVASTAFGGTVQYGYNLAIMNVPTVYIQNFINETFQERWGMYLEVYKVTLIWTFIVSVFSLGGLIGALLAGPMSIHFGRKKTLLLNNIFLMSSALLAVTSRTARSFEMIMISRFLVGINAGVSMNVQPMYFGESAPKHLRGAVSLSSAVFTSFGVVLGQVVGLRELLGCESCWQYLLASNAVPGFIQLFTLPWFPESPRYLLIDRGDKDACLKALRLLRGCEVQRSELDEMLQEQAEVQGKRAQQPWELIADRSVRWQLISITIISSAMQLCGNDSIYFYASYIFQEAGISAEDTQYVTIGTGICEFTACILCVSPGSHNIVIWIVCYDNGINFPIAGVTGILPTEIFNQTARPAAYMIAGSLMWLNLFIIGMVFPFLVSGLGQFCFVPFGAVCLITALFVGLVLPETNGKTLSMITSEFHMLNFREQERTDPKSKQAHYQQGEVIHCIAL